MSGLQHTMRRWMTILLLLQLDEVDSFIPRPTAVTTSFRPGRCSLSLRTPRRAIDRDSALEEKEEEEAEISPMNYSDTEDGDTEKNFTALPMEGIDAVRLDFYARVRAVWTRLVSSITEQLSRGRVWLEEEAMGSIWFLAFLNFSFLAGVAAFAAWNIEVLGGKKWSAPPIVTPEVRAAPTAKKVVFRKPQWRFPTSVRGTYSEDLSSPSKSSPLSNEPDGESREGSVGTIERIRDA